MITQAPTENTSPRIMRREKMLKSRHVRSLLHASVQHGLEYLESRQLLSADLTGSFTVVPTTVTNGSSQAVTLHVVNDGDAVARGPLAVDLYIQPAGGSGGSFIKHVIRVGGLAAGASRNVTIAVPFSAALTAGNYQLVAILDPKNKVAESNESNNTITSSTIDVTQRDFNLSAGFAKVQASITTAALGSKTNGTVFVTLKNTGTVSSPAGFPINVQVFARPAGTVGTGSDVLINRFTVDAPGAIAAGGTRTIAVPVQFPATLPAGSFDLVVDANGTNSLAETNLADNTFTSTTPITVAAENVSPTPVTVVTFPTPVSGVSPTAGNPTSAVLPTTGVNGLLPTDDLDTSVVPTTNLGVSVLPTTNLDTISLIGDTPLNSLGNTPLNSLGDTPLATIGDTPLDSLGNTPLNSTSVTPIDSIGNISFSSLEMTI